jgi:hypothetical protein
VVDLSAVAPVRWLSLGEQLRKLTWTWRRAKLGQLIRNAVQTSSTLGAEHSPRVQRFHFVAGEKRLPFQHLKLVERHDQQRSESCPVSFAAEAAMAVDDEFQITVDGVLD